MTKKKILARQNLVRLKMDMVKTYLGSSATLAHDGSTHHVLAWRIQRRMNWRESTLNARNVVLRRNRVKMTVDTRPFCFVVMNIEIQHLT